MLRTFLLEILFEHLFRMSSLKSVLMLIHVTLTQLLISMLQQRNLLAELVCFKSVLIKL